MNELVATEMNRIEAAITWTFREWMNWSIVRDIFLILIKNE